MIMRRAGPTRPPATKKMGGYASRGPWRCIETTKSRRQSLSTDPDGSRYSNSRCRKSCRQARNYKIRRMRRSKTRRSPPPVYRGDQEPPREEHEIFSELAALCTAPGFAHAIAFFCYRDNLVRFGKELTPDDLTHLSSGSQLIRTEISTLIGLLTRHPEVDPENGTVG